ncbi:hypothetical protein PR048_006966 [Dryococelus australis]|uniref:Uncharacterized protein n=1 Tax=Dryococelus australis TaxID=614101 RepID=A0ABQ9IDR1_9NEOP|nr:hypothetical protein PR048_006966 [Dryococelus australis]
MQSRWRAAAMVTSGCPGEDGSCHPQSYPGSGQFVWGGGGSSPYLLPTPPWPVAWAAHLLPATHVSGDCPQSAVLCASLLSRTVTIGRSRWKEHLKNNPVIPKNPYDRVKEEEEENKMSERVTVDARLPHAKIRELPRAEIEPGSPRWETLSLATTSPRLLCRRTIAIVPYQRKPHTIVPRDPHSSIPCCVSSCTIPMCEDPAVIPPRIEPGSPRSEASGLADAPPLPPPPPFGKIIGACWSLPKTAQHPGICYRLGDTVIMRAVPPLVDLLLTQLQCSAVGLYVRGPYSTLLKIVSRAYLGTRNYFPSIVTNFARCMCECIRYNICSSSSDFSSKVDFKSAHLIVNSPYQAPRRCSGLTTRLPVRTGFDSPYGRPPPPPPNFRVWESCRTMPLVGGFSRGSPVYPALSFRSISIPRFTLIGSLQSTMLSTMLKAHLQSARRKTVNTRRPYSKTGMSTIYVNRNKNKKNVGPPVFVPLPRCSAPAMATTVPPWDAPPCLFKGGGGRSPGRSSSRARSLARAQVAAPELGRRMRTTGCWAVHA